MATLGLEWTLGQTLPPPGLYAAVEIDHWQSGIPWDCKWDMWPPGGCWGSEPSGIGNHAISSVTDSPGASSARLERTGLWASLRARDAGARGGTVNLFGVRGLVTALHSRWAFLCEKESDVEPSHSRWRFFDTSQRREFMVG
jgi:hypothetical protein